VLRPLLRLGVEQPERPGQPAVGLRAFALEAQVDRQHERGDGRLRGRVVVEVVLVGQLVAGDRLVGSAEPVRGLGQRVEVVAVELGRPGRVSRRGEAVVGRLPVARRERCASRLESVHRR
jgi:hypothetical protein